MDQHPIVLVASVSIIKDNKVLMIQENKPSIKGKWNFPSGRIEKREDILVAACREVKEETGVNVKLTHTTGVYNFVSLSDDQVILFHFIGEQTSDSVTVDEAEILETKWLLVQDLVKMDPKSLREPKLIKQITQDILDRRVYPLDIVKKPLF